MFNKLKQIQELKSQANQIKNALSEESIEGVNTNRTIKITMDGNQEAKSIIISDEIIGDKEKLQTGIKEAVNDAIKKVQRVMAEKMSNMGNLPF